MLEIAFLVFGIIPHIENNPIEDRVDLVEVNHVHNDVGEIWIDQLIFYDWNPYICRFECRDFRIIKARKHNINDQIVWKAEQAKKPVMERQPYIPPYLWTNHHPRKDHDKDEYYMLFMDVERKWVGGKEEEYKNIRLIKAKCFRESWTQYDVETAERDLLPRHRRRPLTPHDIQHQDH